MAVLCYPGDKNLYLIRVENKKKTIISRIQSCHTFCTDNESKNLKLDRTGYVVLDCTALPVRQNFPRIFLIKKKDAYDIIYSEIDFG